MEKVLFVALGGGIGAGLRYLLTELVVLCQDFGQIKLRFFVS